MSYWQFRLRLYNESLKQWLESVKQISYGLVALFPLAVPALIFLPFVAWGILADPGSEQTRYVNTLWGYLLFVYAWMHLQHHGIVATQHQYYVASLPTTDSKKQWVELGLIVYGANILLLGPLYLLLSMLYQQANTLWQLPLAFVIEQLTPILGLIALVSYYCVAAVRVSTLPWLSLLLMPLFVLPWVTELAKGQCLVLWCAAILVERQLSLPRFKLGSWPTGFYRLQLQADIYSPRSESLRFVGVLLVSILLGLMFHGVKPEAQSYVAGFLSFCAALIMASSLFDALSLIERYQGYFNSLPVSTVKRLSQCVCYVLCKAIPGLLLLAYIGVFTAIHWGLWLVFYVTSLMGIMHRPKWFFIWPVISAIVLYLLVA
ncbi:DUF6136 family protein [Flavobacterium sp. W21_SRS_FM6]|uniref:DUF6136 family protein n=1 Tax=Flavobacterium sp. W21_SRS_FM6 TaxID=3240268 RepID=UPI003F90A757